MKLYDVFETIRIRLYELCEARSYVLHESEAHQLSFYRNLRMTDIIMELLRYKTCYQSKIDNKESEHRQQDWTTRRDRLFRDLQASGNQCLTNPTKPRCSGGPSECDMCRDSILSIASQINTLTVGFMGTVLNLDDEWGTHDHQNIPFPVAEYGQVTVDPSTMKQELDSVKSELAKAKKETEELKKANHTDRDKLSKLRKERDNTMEMLKTSVKIVMSYNGLKHMVWDSAFKSCEALDAMFNSKLEDLAVSRNSSNEQDGIKTTIAALENESMGNQEHQVRVLINLNKHKEAQPIAERVLEWRRKQPDIAGNGMLVIFRDYCKILEKLKNDETLEFECIQVWYNKSPGREELKEHAGTCLARMKKRHEEVEEAITWFRKVAACRLKRDKLDLAAESALEMIATQKSYNLSLESTKLLAEVWNRGQQSNAKVDQSPNVLSCGQEMGNIAIQFGRYDEAKTILVAVWKAWEQHGSKYIPKRTIAALSLAAIIPQLAQKHDTDIQNLYKWISEETKEKGDKRVSLQYKHQLGCLQLSHGDETGEKTLQDAWETARKELGSADIDTIQFGWDYGEALSRKEERHTEAKNVFKLLWGALELVQKKDKDWTKALKIAMLSTGRAYSFLLESDAEACTNEKDQKKGYEDAEKVLSKAWTVAGPMKDDLLKDRNIGALTDMLWVGDTYGECLSYLGHYKKSVQVLSDVLKLRKTWNPDPSETELTSRLLKEAKDMEAKDKEAKDKEAKDKEAKDKEAKDKEAKDKDVKDKETKKPDSSTREKPSPSPPKHSTPPKPRVSQRKIKVLRFFVS